jgi:hypothetical protein
MTVTAARTNTWARVVRHVVGGLYLTTAGVNVGLVVADPTVYERFASESFLPFVRRLWEDVVMADPTPWILLLAAGELVLGVLLLLGGRPARVGWVGVVVFHVLLMLFGFGFWLWSLPALALLVTAARADWPHLTPRTASPPAAVDPLRR